MFVPSVSILFFSFLKGTCRFQKFGQKILCTSSWACGGIQAIWGVSLFLSICLSVYHLSVYLSSICLSIICLSVYLAVCLSSVCLSIYHLGLGDISHAICMRISSVKPVPWLTVNLHHLFSNGAAFNTQSHSSQTSYAYIDWYIAFDMNAILRSLSVIYGSVY